MKHKIAIINWVDASIHGSNTFTRKEAEESWLMEGVVVGLLVKEDKEKVVIAMDWFPKEDTFRTLQVYPKSGITKIQRLSIGMDNKNNE